MYAPVYTDYRDIYLKQLLATRLETLINNCFKCKYFDTKYNYKNKFNEKILQ